MSTFKIFCFLILASFTINIYFVYLINTYYTKEQCLKIGFKYINSLYKPSSKNGPLVESFLTTETKVVETQTTTDYKTTSRKNINEIIESEEDKLQVSLVEPYGIVKHCITDEVIGIIPNNTQTVKLYFSNVFLSESANQRMQSFQKVFKNKAWGHRWDENQNGLSVSGRGSTLYWAQNVIGVLHKIINDIKTSKGNNYRVKMLDVPCGDFAWMSRFLSTRDDIDYTGMDIVPEIINHLDGKYKNKNWKFVNGDIATMDVLEGYDIILCRMLLQHLHSSDIKRVLKAFSKNANGLLVTTTYSEKNINEELKFDDPDNPGRFRELNLEIPPYSLIPPTCVSRDGMPGEISSPNIFLGVWRLPLRRVRKCNVVQSFKVTKFNSNFSSCTKWL